MTTILIRKLNAGVSFQILLKGGRFSARKPTERDKGALYAALDWYCERVMGAALRHGVSLRNPADQLVSVSKSDPSLFLPLEPWGFASGSFEEPLMGDSGSCPTPSRARALLCYQAPLAVKKENDSLTFSRTLEVEHRADLRYYTAVQRG
jgi:hypothetical protein